MLSRFLNVAWPVVLFVSLVGFGGCAGKGPSGGGDSGGGGGESSAAAEKTQKLEDARKSAEEAELKAHQLREEKARSAAKSPSR